MCVWHSSKKEIVGIGIRYDSEHSYEQTEIYTMSGDLYLDGLVPKAKVRSCCCSFVTIDEEPNPHILPQKVHWIYWFFCKRFDRLH